MKQVLIIGAGGQMTGRTAKTLAQHFTEGVHYVFTDISQDALGRVSEQLPGDLVSTMVLDLYESQALDSAVAQADFVIHGAGPFHKTASLVRPLCIKHGAHYMDIDDDVESNLEAIELGPAATAANVGLFVGCGASPGLTNVLAAGLIKQLDTVEDVEVAWCVGNEPEMELGRAVLEHTMHIGAGDCVTWRNGKPVTHQSFLDSTEFEMGPGLGTYRLYECAHPETVMIPHSYQNLNNVTCWGGMHPQPVNGLLKGVAHAVREGKISMDAACAFFKDVIEGRSGQAGVWRYALGGAWRQISAGESSLGALLDYFWQELRGRAQPPQMGLAARVTGSKDGKKIELTQTTLDHAAGSALDSMEAATGLSQAAFALQVLRGVNRTGCQFPEAWVDTDQFMSDLNLLADRQSQQLVSDVSVSST